jgi:methyl-accepting chemotaxis protein
MHTAKIKKEISKAISAHGMWKNTLRNAIETGKSSSTPEKVQQDNNCSFGKWLHTRIDPSMRESSMYKQIVETHKKFHIQAALILTLALARKTEEATEGIKLGSEFSKSSSLLISQLSEWEESL